MPPVATNVWLYATPRLPPSKAEVVIVNGPGAFTRQVGKVKSTSEGPTLTTLVTGVNVNGSKVHSTPLSVAVLP